jgi:glycosyltransferase involved in cell wall biosynthesis
VTKQKVICFISNLSLKEEPTVENRLLPYISQTLKAGYKVILISRDRMPLDSIVSKDFCHKCFPEKKHRPNGFIARAIHENKTTKELLLNAKKYSVDVFMLTIPSMFLLFNARVLKGCRLFLDVRDLTWHYLSKTSFLQKTCRHLFELIASRSFKYFEQIVVTNQTEQAYFCEQKVKAHLNFNGITQEQYAQLSSIKPKKSSKSIVVTYVGKVGVAQNLDFIIEVAKILPNVIFNIVGYGPLYSHFQQKVEVNKIQNINTPGSADWEQVIEYYKNSDILYAQLISDFSGAMPSKLYQYLCSSRYIIYGGEGQAKTALGLFLNNNVISPNSVDELVSAIVYFQDKLIDINGYDVNLEVLKTRYVREFNANEVVKYF